MIDSLSLFLFDEPSFVENEGFLVSNRTVSLFIYLSPLTLKYWSAPCLWRSAKPGRPVEFIYHL